ncbi:MAG: CPBP family intramembrane glutamic endopeptidase [Pirellulales bacterium]
MSILPPVSTSQGKATWLLFTAPWLLLIWKIGCEPAVLQRLAERLAGPEVWRGTGGIASMLAGVMLFGVGPAIVVKRVFRESLADYGWGLGIRFRTVRSFLIALPVAVVGTYWGSFEPSLPGHYPVNPAAGDSLSVFLVHAATYLAFYFAWEFYFRGFLQHGMAPALGMVPAALVQTLASALMHIGKPPSEAFVSILGGLLWGWLVCRTRSIVSGSLQHAFLGIGLDALLCLRQNGFRI